MRWLLRWQHISPGSQVQGERATLDVLRQLQGFEIPASAWERHILGRRISNYDPRWLDQLCLTGAVGWGRLSPHPATLDDTSAGKRRVIPTSVAPITFFVREEADWMTAHRPPSMIDPRRAADAPVPRKYQTWGTAQSCRRRALASSGRWTMSSHPVGLFAHEECNRGHAGRNHTPLPG